MCKVPMLPTCYIAQYFNHTIINRMFYNIEDWAASSYLCSCSVYLQKISNIWYWSIKDRTVLVEETCIIQQK